VGKKLLVHADARMLEAGGFTEIRIPTRRYTGGNVIQG
jgi:hypothetical protein